MSPLSTSPHMPTFMGICAEPITKKKSLKLHWKTKTCGLEPELKLLICTDPTAKGNSMELNGTQQIQRSRSDVWAALNDLGILQQCIPGCESLEQEQNNVHRIVLMASIGPVKAKFTGKLTLSNIRDDVGYQLTFEGTGGVAGFAKGSAAVVLESIQERTL